MRWSTVARANGPVTQSFAGTPMAWAMRLDAVIGEHNQIHPMKPLQYPQSRHYDPVRSSSTQVGRSPRVQQTSSVRRAWLDRTPPSGKGGGDSARRPRVALQYNQHSRCALSGSSRMVNVVLAGARNAHRSTTPYLPALGVAGPQGLTSCGYGSGSTAVDNWLILCHALQIDESVVKDIAGRVQQSKYSGISRSIVDARAGLASFNDVLRAKDRQLLRYRGRLNAQRKLKLGHGFFPGPNQLKYVNPRGVGERLEELRLESAKWVVQLTNLPASFYLFKVP